MKNVKIDNRLVICSLVVALTVSIGMQGAGATCPNLTLLKNNVEKARQELADAEAAGGKSAGQAAQNAIKVEGKTWSETKGVWNSIKWVKGTWQGKLAGTLITTGVLVYFTLPQIKSLFGITTESDRQAALITAIQNADSSGTAAALNALHSGEINDTFSSTDNSTANGQTPIAYAKLLRTTAQVEPLPGSPSKAQFQVIVNQVSCAGNKADVSLLDPTTEQPLKDPTTNQPMTMNSVCANITTEAQKAALEANIPLLLNAILTHDMNQVDQVLQQGPLANVIMNTPYQGTTNPYFTGKTIMQIMNVLTDQAQLAGYLTSIGRPSPDYYLGLQYGIILNQLACYINDPKNGLAASTNPLTAVAPDFNATVCPHLPDLMTAANANAAIAEPMIAQNGLLSKLVDAIGAQDSAGIAHLLQGVNTSVVANLLFQGLDYSIWQDTPKTLIEIAQAYVNNPPLGNTALVPVSQVIVKQLECLLLPKTDPSYPKGFDCSPVGIKKAITVAQAQGAAGGTGGATGGTTSGVPVTCPPDQTPDATGTICLCLFGGQKIDPTTGSCACPLGQSVSATTFTCESPKKTGKKPPSKGKVKPKKSTVAKHTTKKPTPKKPVNKKKK